MRQPFLLTALLGLGVLPPLPRRKDDEDTPPERERHNPYTGEREFDERHEQVMAGKTNFADAYAREVAAREAHRARVAPALVATRVACAGPAMAPKIERDRSAQRKARKSRKVTKKRRGW